MVKLAFAGFRHVHINTLYKLARENPEVRIVAAWESDPESRAAAEKNLGVVFTHDSYEALLAEKDIDVVAIGSYFGARGAMAIAALKAGKHVYADKPLCTSLDELSEIEALAARTGLKVGCMLDVRRYPWVQPVRDFLLSGKLGRINIIQFGGQHPLLYGSRPHWYFEEGKHGGVINDIAVHGIDLVEYLTGLSPKRVVAAREWNAFATKDPAFKDCAQFMLELSGGAGLMADVSYAAPDSCGYALPFYWRFNIWGSKGAMEFGVTSDGVRVALDGTDGLRPLPIPDEKPANCLEVFLDELAGKPVDLDTAQVIRVTRDTLNIQRAADCAK